jgi:putative ABC transport system permease protein
MVPAPLSRKLLRDLRALGGQAAAIALVLAAGVALFVMALGSVRALDRTLSDYYRDYRFAQVFQSVVRAPQRLEAEIAAIPGVAQVATRVVGPVTLYPPDDGAATPGRVVSIPETQQPTLNRLKLTVGRWPEPGRPDEVLLNRPFAQARDLRPGDTLPAVIDGHRRTLKVVGLALSPEFIYTVGPGQLMPQAGTYGVAWMARPAAAAAFDMKGAFNDVALRLMKDVQPDGAIERLDRLLAPYGGTGGYGRRDHESHAFVRNEIDGLKATARTTPPIFLAVAAFLVNVVVARLVERERGQIGLMKAFGYSDRAVGRHYAGLVGLIAVAGVLIGSAVGAWLGRGLAELYAEFFYFPDLRFSLAPGTFALAALISLAAALVGAALAVRRAVALPPAVAMRPPDPPVFRRGPLERLGALKSIDPATRIVLRNLVRRPVRALLTVLGAATAVALLVGSLFMREAVDVLIRDELNRAQRQDATVSLTDARGPDALAEIAGLPGVQQVQAMRVVPAKLSVGARERRQALQGVPPDAALYRLLTVDGVPADAPELGLALSDKLAELLDVGLGERVRVEVLEGRRPVIELPVTAIATRYVGLAAYLDLDALNRLLGEPDRVSGAYLRLDGAERPALNAALLERPRVAGVSWRADMLASLRRTLDRNLMLMIGTFVVFAGVIAVGVIYNAARVMLSERAHELASLRVLGFRRGEVAYVLLAELAVLVLAALPVGCLLGYGFAWLMITSYSTELMRLPLVVAPDSYAWAMLVVIAAAIAAGALVRRQLDRLDMVSALKVRE